MKVKSKRLLQNGVGNGLRTGSNEGACMVSVIAVVNILSIRLSWVSVMHNACTPSPKKCGTHKFCCLMLNKSAVS